MPACDGFQPRRALRVPAAGIVVGEARVGADEQHVVHGTRRVLSKRLCRAAARPRGHARGVAMSPLNSHTLRWRGGWACIGPFRSDADVARLTMGTDAPPSPSVIERCLGEVQARSYKAVVTNALSQADSAPFVDAGFAVRERLHLLAARPRPAAAADGIDVARPPSRPPRDPRPRRDGLRR